MIEELLSVFSRTVRLVTFQISMPGPVRDKPRHSNRDESPRRHSSHRSSR